MGIINKRININLIGIFILAFFFVGFLMGNFAFADEVASSQQLLSISTGPMGGSFYPIGIGIGEVISKIVGIKTQVEVTGGAIENPTLVQRGESDMCITNADVALDAYNGEGPFKDSKCSDLRILLGGLSASGFHTVVSEKSGINSYADMKGKKVAVGPAGCRTADLFPKILQFFGVDLKDLSITYLNYDEGVQALQDGRVDAALVQAPLPASSVTQAVSVGKVTIKLLPFDPKIREEFIKQYPFMIALDIPIGMYKNEETVPVLGIPNVVLVSSKMTDETAYNITKAIWENIDIIKQSHPSAKNMKIEKAPVDFMPIHLGAAKYYKEVGVME